MNQLSRRENVQLLINTACRKREMSQSTLQYKTDDDSTDWSHFCENFKPVVLKLT